jgi:hypothetical protein
MWNVEFPILAVLDENPIIGASSHAQNTPVGQAADNPREHRKKGLTFRAKFGLIYVSKLRLLGGL